MEKGDHALENIKDITLPEIINNFYSRYGKRATDIIASFVLLILFTPFLIFFSLMLFLLSGRPIFFKQIRSGIYNTSFKIWKFRTMQPIVEESSSHQYDWEHEVPKDFSFEKPIQQDITRIGKIYRKYSIDEIPQLWNVLKGDMSFVGPRPEMVEITRYYSDEQKKRLKVKPGITGYAQINGRSEISHGKKMELDHYYVEHCSLVLDFKIIIYTVLLVIRGKGAY
ncbi:sugar transferase [Bacillus sp. FJAT-22090]|uniref:sugar transferase n=1 Tax=Bacillus sp. FJAT-22090 TaxID=1581038 RepID=UPI0011A40858|nr:sugar transferase [Bacillus sp. FJAT-22090]